MVPLEVTTIFLLIMLNNHGNYSVEGVYDSASGCETAAKANNKANSAPEKNNPKIWYTWDEKCFAVRGAIPKGFRAPLPPPSKDPINPQAH
jgi:hypothetical protein